MGQSGDKIEAQNANWKFNGTMVEHFEEHVSKSVPFIKKDMNSLLNLVIIL